MREKSVVFLCLLSLLLGACGDRRDVYREQFESFGPFAYPLGLAFINGALDELLRVRVVAENEAGQLQQSIVTDRVWLQRPGATQVRSVDDGRTLAVLHGDPAQPGISLLPNAGKQVERFLPLADAFDGLALAPSSHYGVAYFTSASSEHTGIRNLNQIQVIRFAEPAQVFAPLALETGGLNPRGVDFLPLGAEEFDDVAAIRVDNGLVLVDLADPGADPLWVRFTNSPGGTAVPAQIAFGPFFADGGYFYVRLAGAPDVLSVHLTRDGAGRLSRSINFLNTPAGSNPTDLLVLSDPAFFDKVFVVYGGTGQHGAALLDANSIQTDEQTFAFDLSVRSARPLVAETPEGSREFVLVYNQSIGSGSVKAFLVDPHSGSLEAVYLQDGYSQVAGPADGRYVIFFHDRLGSSGLPGMRVLRAALPEGSSHWTHRLSTYGLDATPSGFFFSMAGQHMLAAFEGGLNTFLLDLQRGTYETMLLSEQALAMGVIPETDWAWFLHAHPLGKLTLVPITPFRSADAVVVEGLLLMGLFDPK